LLHRREELDQLIITSIPESYDPLGFFPAPIRVPWEYLASVRKTDPTTWVDRALVVGAVMGLGAFVVSSAIAAIHDSSNCIPRGAGFCRQGDIWVFVSFLGLVLGGACMIARKR
jgi:hypothetical protein